MLPLVLLVQARVERPRVQVPVERAVRVRVVRAVMLRPGFPPLQVLAYISWISKVENIEILTLLFSFLGAPARVGQSQSQRSTFKCNSCRRVYIN